MAQRKQKKKQFLWVNKDEESLSLSSSDRTESQRIFQFVQRQRVGPATEKKDIRRKPRSLARSVTDPGPGQSPPRQHRPLSIR